MDLYTIRNALNGGTSIFDLPLRVTYYARVSTDKDEQLHSLSAQMSYYTEFIQSNPAWSYVEGYVDEGISGTTVGKRENFLRMVEDAGAGRFDFVVTKEISRFSRNTLDSIRYTQELLHYGVGVLFQADNINTLMPDAELRLTIMSSIAQDEVRKISERVRFGFRRAIEHGVVLGNSRIWGYEKREGRLVIQEEEAELVRLIFDLYANQQMGIRAIAAYLTERGYLNSRGNGFSFSTIRGILSNPKYKGCYCGGKSCKYDYKLSDRKYFPPEEWVMYQDEENVPPIVSPELWEKANRILAQRSLKQSAPDKSSYQNKYPYSGKILCGVHNQPCHRALYRCRSGSREVWQCREYARKGRTGCPTPVLYSDELDDIIRQVLGERPEHWAELADRIWRMYVNLGEKTGPGREIARCRGDMDEILRRKDKLLDLSVQGRLSDQEFAQRNDRFNRELDQLQERLAALNVELQKSRSLLENEKQLKSSIDKEFNFTGEFSIGMIDALLESVRVVGERDGSVAVAVQLRQEESPRNYAIRRNRGRPSLCTRQYT